MCFSASISYSASGLLVASGIYAVLAVRRLPGPYWLLALIPVYFGMQQAFEGRVWQMLGAGRFDAAVPFAVGYHFFSHFLWLWWIPLSIAMIETGRVRRQIFLGVGAFGALAGGSVFFTLLLHPEWLEISIKNHSIVYDINSPVRGIFRVPVPASALYALIILVPLLFSSHRHVRIFGVLVVLSVVIASISYGYAFVSVWCFFAAMLSLYLVYMIRVSPRIDRLVH